MKSDIKEFLLSYDCPIKYIGFSLLGDALSIASRFLGEIKVNLKCIYIELQEKHKMSRVSIERNLKTLVEAWSQNKKFKELFDVIPTNAELIISLTHKCTFSNSSVYDILLT